LKKAQYSDKKLVADILVSAFTPKVERNSINHVVKQDRKRVERMHVLMEYLFERAFYFGEVFISDNNQSCILIKYSYKEKVTLRTIRSDLKLAFKCIGIERVFKVLRRQQVVKRHYPKEKHIQPLIFGVKVESKGNGNAARLMLEVKDYYKDNNLPAIVDAASEQNAKLYQKIGFKIIKIDESLGFPIYYLRIKMQ
jgi:ribosomal protein S18 acetylase RimI-like enzyme